MILETVAIVRSASLATSLVVYCLAVVLVAQNAQDGEEQVDDVQIQRDGGGNLLLDVVVAHDELGVDEDVAGEDERRDAAVHELQRAARGEEGGHEPEDDEEPQRAEQVGDPVREVVLGLAREQRQRDEDAQRDDQRLHDDPRVVERRDHADRVRLQRREPRQEEQVRRVALALPVRQEHEPDRAEQGHHHEPEVRLDPSAVRVAEERDCAQHRGQKNLDGSAWYQRLLEQVDISEHLQDGVDLANELHPDREGALPNRAPELDSHHQYRIISSLLPSHSMYIP